MLQDQLQALFPVNFEDNFDFQYTLVPSKSFKHFESWQSPDYFNLINIFGIGNIPDDVKMQEDPFFLRMTESKR